MVCAVQRMDRPLRVRAARARFARVGARLLLRVTGPKFRVPARRGLRRRLQFAFRLPTTTCARAPFSAPRRCVP